MYIIFRIAIVFFFMSSWLSCSILSGNTPTPEPIKPNTFPYYVKVVNIDTNNSLEGVLVSVKIDDTEIITGTTILDGITKLSILEKHQNTTAVLSAEFKGYSPFSSHINFAVNNSFTMPYKINLEKDEFSIGPVSTQPTEIASTTPIPPTPTTTTNTPETALLTETPILTPTATPVPLPTTPTIIPSATPTESPTSRQTEFTVPTPTIPMPPADLSPTGKLAIPLMFGFEPRVYITGFDGEGVNSENYFAVPKAKQPMWGWEGNSIMVNAELDGVRGLFKLDAIGLSREVVIDRGSARWPIISPEGDKIIFSEETLGDLLIRREQDGDTEEFVQITLQGRPILGRHLLWTEDNIMVFQGCRVWDVGHEGECGVWITDPINPNPQRIIEGNHAIPKDAKKGLLAYMSSIDGDWEVFIMPLRGTEEEAVQLTNNDIPDGLPAISPNGDMVAYLTNTQPPNGPWEVWTVDINGEQATLQFSILSERGSIDFQKWADDRMSWAP